MPDVDFSIYILAWDGQDEIRDVRNIFDMELQKRHSAALAARQEEERAELAAQGYQMDIGDQ